MLASFAASHSSFLSLGSLRSLTNQPVSLVEIFHEVERVEKTPDVSIDKIDWKKRVGGVVKTRHERDFAQVLRNWSNNPHAFNFELTNFFRSRIIFALAVAFAVVVDRGRPQRGNGRSQRKTSSADGTRLVEVFWTCLLRWLPAPDIINPAQLAPAL